MIEEAIEIKTADGVAGGFVYHEDRDTRRPGVLHLTDIGGIRDSHRKMASRLAAAGYIVVLPNVFYRTGKPPMFDFTPRPGDERTMKRFGELAQPLTPEAMERDAAAYVDYLSSLASVKRGPAGVVGYCFTGSMAMRTAAVRPETVRAVASFHGGGLYTDAPTSPHLVLPRIRARMHFGHAVEDRSMPKEAIEKFDQALAAWGGVYESKTYEGAHHGWTVPDSPVFNQAQADLAFANLTALLAAALAS